MSYYSLIFIYLNHFFLCFFSADLLFLLCGDESDESLSLSLLLESSLLLSDDELYLTFSTLFTSLFSYISSLLESDDTTSKLSFFLIVLFQSPSNASGTSGAFSLFNSYCNYFSLKITIKHT